MRCNAPPDDNGLRVTFQGQSHCIGKAHMSSTPWGRTLAKRSRCPECPRLHKGLSKHHNPAYARVLSSLQPAH